MNIFYLDENPAKAAQAMCDKHVVKMVLETAQILCSLHDQSPYKRTHYNHPCCKWARESLANYSWLCDLGMALAREYTHRFSKTHKSQWVLEWCIEMTPGDLPDSGITTRPQCVLSQFKNECPITAYRDYYIYKISIMKNPKWTFRDKPEWL